MAKSTHIRVLLVRAGASAWDETGRMSGSADLPLTEAGRAAVASFASGLEPGSLCQVWSGPEESAGETAQAIGRATGAKVKLVESLHELGIGLWEGLAEADAGERVGRAFRQWREDPESVVPPGGESVTDAAERVAGQVRTLLGRSRGDESCGVCLVLRPMVLGIVRCWLTGEGFASMWSVSRDPLGEWLLVDRESVRSGRAGGPGAVRSAG